jgi:hypothetical protein
MKKVAIVIVVFVLNILTAVGLLKGQQSVVKTNPMKVYMHYMPWFETPATIGTWGWHWKMNTMDPEITDAEGHRQIASHFYPLIGPYASGDKDVIEYHLLLMKLSGIDGILINWYGVQGSNGDINMLLTSSDSIIAYTDDFGMQFGVVLEDRFSRNKEDVKANLAYLKDNYFAKSSYINYGDANVPLVSIFGPITFTTSADWEEILPSAGDNIEFLTLWYNSGMVGNQADGEFMWVYQDERNHLEHLNSFYTNRASSLNTVVGVAYPGFEDFYEEGGSGPGYFTIPHEDGATLAETLDKAVQNKSKIDMVQLVTFNDFGEGTMFEPTVETGFEYLKKVQRYTGVSFGEKELRLVYRLINLRKENAGNQTIQNQLDEASMHLRNIEIDNAAEIINLLDPNAIIQNKNISCNETPLNIFPNPYTVGPLNIISNFKTHQPLLISIYNTFGKEVYKTSTSVIKKLNLTKGIYIVTVQDKNQMQTGKFVIK